MPVLGKHLRIERRNKTASGTDRTWRILPNAERVTVWDMSQADATDDGSTAAGKRHIFHIDFVEGVTKQCRAVFFSETYQILEVSDSSKRLRGLELHCVRAS